MDGIFNNNYFMVLGAGENIDKQLKRRGVENHHRHTDDEI